MSVIISGTKSLDELVDESWRALQFSLAIGEKVQFKVKNKEDRCVTQTERKEDIHASHVTQFHAHCMALAN